MAAAKLHLLRARRPAKPKVKPGRGKGTARDGSAAGRHNSSARPSVCGGGLAGLINVSTINRTEVCVVGERRGAKGGEEGEKKNLKRSEKTSLHHQRGLFQVLE